MHAQNPSVEDLIPVVYDDLRRAAAGFFRKQPPGFTLQPTELVNEACIHLIQHSRGPWRDAQHFRAIATRKIWQVVVDHLRARRALKRHGATGTAETASSPDGALASPQGARNDCGRRVPLDDIGVEWNDRIVDLLDLAAALETLLAVCRRKHQIVMLHWFGGMPYADVGRLLGLSSSAIEKDFRYTLAWLNRALEGPSAHAK